MQDPSDTTPEEQLAELEVERQVGRLSSADYQERRRALLAQPLSSAPPPDCAPQQPVDSQANNRRTYTTSTRGHLSDLPLRVVPVAEALGAAWCLHEDCVEVLLPVASGRSRTAEVFILSATNPCCKGNAMIGVESDAGVLPLSLRAALLLGGLASPSYAKTVVAEREGEQLHALAQGFLPLEQALAQDLAALIHDVCNLADTLEARLGSTR